MWYHKMLTPASFLVCQTSMSCLVLFRLNFKHGTCESEAGYYGSLSSFIRTISKLVSILSSSFLNVRSFSNMPQFLYRVVYVIWICTCISTVLTITDLVHKDSGNCLIFDVLRSLAGMRNDACSNISSSSKTLRIWLAVSARGLVLFKNVQKKQGDLKRVCYGTDVGFELTAGYLFRNNIRVVIASRTLNRNRKD